MKALVARLDDWLNPVLVREVRQDLRGKGFRNAFWFTICVATVIGAVMIGANQGGSTLGEEFFFMVYACLGLSTCLIVPAMAFQSVGAEAEEMTQDLLVLSNLRPRQIVWGKFLSAMTQSMLYFSALGPFLVFAFLLRGLDLSYVVIGLWTAFTQSALSVTVGIFLSSLSRQRAVRVLLLVIFVIYMLASLQLFITLPLVSAMATAGSSAPSSFMPFLIGDFIGKVPLIAFLFAVACTRFAHPEENRSTPLRIILALLVQGMVLFRVLLPGVFRGSFTLADLGTGTVRRELVLSAFLTLTVGSLFFVTEREALGWRVRNQVPARPALATVAMPWLPGGARGFLYYVLNGVLLFLIAVVANSANGGDLRELRVLALASAYGMIFLGIPSALCSKMTKSTPGRISSLVSCIVVLLVSTVGSLLLAFLTNSFDQDAIWHIGNPFVILAKELDGDAQHELHVILILSAGLLGMLLNVPRLLRNLKEIRWASRRKRERLALEASS